MRVPSVGLPLDERRIVREAYQLAERMLRNYDDAPVGLAALVGNFRKAVRQAMLDLHRVFDRDWR